MTKVTKLLWNSRWQLLNLMISLKHASFQHFPSLPFFCSYFFSTSPNSFSRAYLNLLWQMEKIEWSLACLFQQHLQEMYREMSRTQRAALLTPSPHFSVYRLFFNSHLRKGREWRMWFGSELMRDIEGRGMKDVIGLSLSWRSNESLFWRSACLHFQGQ